MTATDAASGTVTPAPVALPVPGRALFDEIRRLGFTHVITVPDTHQKTLLSLLAETERPRLLTVCTEDEAIAINAGLYIGGQQPMMLIQNNGLLASINAMKAIALEARVPTFMLVGQFARDVTKPNAESHLRAVRMIEPTLETWGVPCYPIESPDDLPRFAEAYQRCLEERGPSVVLLGAPTS
jgi:sulfopyruvate decarboxylase subunit alpha